MVPPTFPTAQTHIHRPSNLSEQRLLGDWWEQRPIAVATYPWPGAVREAVVTRINVAHSLVVGYLRSFWLTHVETLILRPQAIQGLSAPLGEDGGWRTQIMCEWFSRLAPWCQQSELLVGKEGLENQWELLIRYKELPELHPTVTQILVLGREWCGAAVLQMRWGAMPATSGGLDSTLQGPLCWWLCALLGAPEPYGWEGVSPWTWASHGLWVQGLSFFLFCEVVCLWDILGFWFLL